MKGRVVRSFWPSSIYLHGRLYNWIDEMQLYSRSQETLGFYPSDKLDCITLDNHSSGFQYTIFNLKMIRLD